MSTRRPWSSSSFGGRERRASAVSQFGRALTSSILATVEVARAVAGRLPDSSAAVAAVFETLSVLAFDARIAARAAALSPAGLRALEAIHLATALELADELAAFVSYDDRLSAAARDLGMPVVSQRATPEDIEAQDKNRPRAIAPRPGSGPNANSRPARYRRSRPSAGSSSWKRFAQPHGQRSFRPSFSASSLSPWTTRSPRRTFVSDGYPTPALTARLERRAGSRIRRGHHDGPLSTA